MTSVDDQPSPGISYITVGEIAIAVDVVRNGVDAGPTIAWLHGLGSSSIVAFAHLARHPALTGTTSLLIDLPGHGLSDKPGDWTYAAEDHAGIVIQVLASLVGKPVVLFGHSMGGTIAIASAGAAQESVERMLLAEPSVDPGSGHLSAHIAAQPEERFVRKGYPTLLRITERQAARGDPAAQSFLPSLRLASPIAMHRSATSLCEERTPSFREQLAGITRPKALITGDLSQPFEPLLDGAHLKGYVVRGARHIMMADNPDGFVLALVTALALPTQL